MAGATHVLGAARLSCYPSTVLRTLPLVVLAACGRIGFDPLGGAVGDDVASDAGGDGARAIDAPITCTPVTSCPEGSLSVDETSSVGDGNTISADRGLAGSCGGAAGAETTWQLTTAGTGTYTISATSAASVVLYVRDQCCTGPELGCSAMPTTMPIAIPLDDGHRVVIIADGATIGTNVSIMVQGSP